MVGNVYLEQCGAPANAQCWVDVYDYSNLTGSFGRGKYRGRFACTKVSDGHYKFQLPGNYNVHHNIADYCDAINAVIDKVCGLNAWTASGSGAKQFMCLQISAALASGIVSAPVAAGFLVACEGVSTALDAGCALVNGNMDLPEGTPGLGDGLCAVLREIDYTWDTPLVLQPVVDALLSNISGTSQIYESNGTLKDMKVTWGGNPIIAPFSSVFLDVEINLGSNYSFFERDISIYTNFKKEPYPIFVRASRKMPVQVIRQEFPLKISEKLRINTPFLIMGNINFGGSKLGYINILNTSDKSVSFSAEITEARSFVSIFHEKKIAPNQVGRIIIIIDLSEIKDIWGLQKYHLLIKSEGKRLIIPIEAIFVEKFIKKVDKPRLLVPVSSYTIDTSIHSEVKFLYRNIGKDTLHIRNIKRNGPADFISVGSYQIPPESQDTIKVKLEKGQKGEIELGITTNDPIEPYKILHIFCKPSKK